MIDVVARHHLRRDAGDDRRLAALAQLSAVAEPVPAALEVGAPGLCRIGDDEAELVRGLVDASAGGELFRRLLAAVQHHHERQRLSAIHLRQVQMVEARPGAIDEDAPREAPGRRPLAKKQPCGGHARRGEHQQPSKSHCYLSSTGVVTTMNVRSVKPLLRIECATPGGMKITSCRRTMVVLPSISIAPSPSSTW